MWESHAPTHARTHSGSHSRRLCVLSTSDSAANAVPCPSVAVSPIQFRLSAGVVGIASDDSDPCKGTRLRLISRLPRPIPPPPSCRDTVSQGLSRDTPKRRRRTFDRASASRSNDSARIRISWCVQGCVHSRVRALKVRKYQGRRHGYRDNRALSTGKRDGGTPEQRARSL